MTGVPTIPKRSRFLLGPRALLAVLRLALGALLALAALTLAPTPALAQDATWLLNPGSNVFNTDANWTPATVPTGTATFGQSNTTALGFSASITVNTLQFNAGAPAYTFNVSVLQFVTLAGTGVVNNSSNAPTFNNALGFLQFNSTATAGNAIVSNTPGATTFTDSSTAGTATITNSLNGTLSFTDTSTAGSAMITTNTGSLAQFTTSSTGGNAQFVTDASGTVDFSGTTGPSSDNKFTAGSIAGAGSYLLGAGQLTVGGNALSTTVSGVVADGGTSGGTGASLVKVGNGTLTLGGANTYTGATTINAGTLAVTGSIASPVTVNSGGTLGGTGTTSNAVTVNSGGALAPGLSTGIINTGNLTLTAASTLAIEINGTTVGTQYDQVNVTGTVTLGGATLSVILGFTPTTGQVFTIINNDGADAVTGTFAGLAEGATFTVSGTLFQVSYAGGDGNDVTLLAMGAAPIPTLSEWAQLGMIALLIVGGLLALRRSSGQALRRRRSAH